MVVWILGYLRRLSLCIVSVRSSLFRNDLCHFFSSHRDQYQCFWDDLQGYWDSLSQFKQALVPLAVDHGTDTDAYSPPGESLIRALLGVDILQSDLIEYLVQKLPELSDDPEDSRETNLVTLVIRQLRWLDYVVDPESLANQLMEIVTVLSVDAQKDVIGALPDVIVDSEHQYIAEELVKLLQSYSPLMIPILDTLSNLQCPTSVTDQLQHTVLGRLRSADADDLPVMLKFLFQTASTESAPLVVSRIRKNLDLESIRSSVPSRDTLVGTLDKLPEVLILDALHFGLQFHKSIGTSWLKLVNELTVPKEHTTLDLAVLCLLYGLPSTQKRILNVLRRKVLHQHVVAHQFSEVIQTYGYALRQHYPTLLSLSENVMRLSTQQPSLAALACHLYQGCFQVFDAYYRQEVVGALVAHIGSGDQCEIDTSLLILLEITQTSAPAIKPFTVFIKGILDYIDNLNLGQVRLLFRLLGYLLRAFPDETGMYDEIHIFIRKQLSSGLDKFKLIGILGGVALVKCLGATTSAADEGPADATSSQATEGNTTVLRNALSLINLVIDSGRLQSWNCLAIAYDELAGAVLTGTLDPRLETWLNENVANSFADLYFCEASSLALPANGAPPTTPRVRHAKAPDYAGDQLVPGVWYDLDGFEDAVMLRLLHFLPGYTGAGEKHSDIISDLVATGKNVNGNPLACLCALFKLFQACEKAANHGSLQEMDAPLGSGVLLFHRDQLQDLCEGEYSSAVVYQARIGLLAAINWYRELINAFADQPSPEMQKKVIQRLENLVSLQDIMRQFLVTTTEFNPSDTLLPTLWANDRVTLSTCLLPNGQLDLAKLGSLAYSRSSAYTAYLREITIDGYQVFRLASLTPYPAPLEKSSGPKGPCTLTPAALCYLLDEFLPKLHDHLGKNRLIPALGTWCLSKSSLPSGHSTEAKGQTSVGYAEQVFIMLARFIPALWQDLWVAFDSLEAFNNEDVHTQKSSPSDTQATSSPSGVASTVSPSKPAYAEYTACIAKLLDALSVFIKWPGLFKVEKRVLAVRTVGALGQREQWDDPAVDNDEPTLVAYAEGAFQCFAQRFPKLPSLSTGLAVHRVLQALYDLTVFHLYPELGTDPGTTKPYQLRERSNTPAAVLAMGSQLSQLATELLRLEGETPKNTLKTADLAYLLYTEIVYLPQPEDKLNHYVHTVFPDFIAQSESTHPCLDDKTFPLFYREVVTAFVDTAIGSWSHLAQRPESYVVDTLGRFRNQVTMWRSLVGMVQAYNNRDVCLVSLKQGKRFVDAFSSHCLGFMEHHFRNHFTIVSSIFKPLQRATRILHTVCGHSKTVRDTRLTALVPPTRRALEVLLYRVKVMFDRNNCLDAFLLGSLKHRNLAGDEVSSQLPPEKVYDSELSDPDNGNESSGMAEVDQFMHRIAERADTSDDDELTKESDQDERVTLQEPERESDSVTSQHRYKKPMAKRTGGAPGKYTNLSPEKNGAAGDEEGEDSMGDQSQPRRRRTLKRSKESDSTMNRLKKAKARRTELLQARRQRRTAKAFPVSAGESGNVDDDEE
ncbi:hypothetical protein IWQ62_003344 [Dispira parvispora]|uniref:Fanconi anemia group D2 protein n=1 Tax=Dispira parvispora TaxID=1520584 RepID=A0A9W8ATZ1_9FUNG|nr:hypothetical protein IWQ62_003344 [Dispira parvispora]